MHLAEFGLEWLKHVIALAKDEKYANYAILGN
jgi:hypothetical protein